MTLARVSTHKLQWGRELSPAEMPVCHAKQDTDKRSFNGAASFRPRRWSPGLAGYEDVDVASMGPRAFARGDLARNPPVSRPTLLQWGRELSPAEISFPSCTWECPSPASMGPRAFARGDFHGGNYLRLSINCASMGPRAFARGDLFPFKLSVISTDKLQWGRELSPAEILREHDVWTVPLSLQWGRELSPAEMKIIPRLMAPSY